MNDEYVKVHREDMLQFMYCMKLCDAYEGLFSQPEASKWLMEFFGVGDKEGALAKHRALIATLDAMAEEEFNNTKGVWYKELE